MTFCCCSDVFMLLTSKKSMCISCLQKSPELFCLFYSVLFFRWPERKSIENTRNFLLLRGFFTLASNKINVRKNKNRSNFKGEGYRNYWVMGFELRISQIVPPPLSTCFL